MCRSIMSDQGLLLHIHGSMCDQEHHEQAKVAEYRKCQLCILQVTCAKPVPGIADTTLCERPSRAAMPSCTTEGNS
jgi:hypothetical protein